MDLDGPHFPSSHHRRFASCAHPRAARSGGCCWICAMSFPHGDQQINVSMNVNPLVIKDANSNSELNILPGWWWSHPSEKSSVGILSLNAKMVQTTNQLPFIFIDDVPLSTSMFLGDFELFAPLMVALLQASVAGKQAHLPHQQAPACLHVPD